MARIPARPTSKVLETHLLRVFSSGQSHRAVVATTVQNRKLCQHAHLSLSRRRQPSLYFILIHSPLPRAAAEWSHSLARTRSPFCLPV